MTTEISKNKISDIAAIRAYYRNEIEQLTPHQEEVRKRLLQAQTLLSEGKQTFEIVSILEKDFSISNAQAFRDLRSATNLYGDIRKAEKEGIRWILYDMAMQTFNDAKAAKDLSAANAAMKNLILITGIDKEDPDAPDFTKLQPPPIVLLFSEEMEKQIATTKDQGVVDLTELFLNTSNIEPLDYEPVPTTGTEKKD